MKKNIDAVYCEFKYSGAALAAIGGAAAATLALVLATPLDAALRAALAAWVLAVAARAVDGIRAVRALRIDGDRGVRVEVAHGPESRGSLRDGSFVAPWLTLVRWRPEGARFDRTVIILPGMLERDAFRRLRTLLRWI